jgi:hypothetical protein
LATFLKFQVFTAGCCFTSDRVVVGWSITPRGAFFEDLAIRKVSYLDKKVAEGAGFNGVKNSN